MKKISLYFLLTLLFDCTSSLQKIEPDTLVMHLPENPSLLNPILAEDGYSSTINARIFESLAERDKQTLEMKPLMAESWQISADKLSYRFQLRKNIRFHDGAPFTAKDVLFSYQIMMSEKIPNAHRKVYFKDVAALTSPDAHTVVFQMRRPYSMALEHLGGFEILPEHIYSKGDFMKDERNYRAPLGSGPYRFTEWKTSQRVVLTRFDDYWGQKPGFKKLEYRIIKNEAVALQALKKQDLDVYNLRPLQWTRQTESEKFNLLFSKTKYLATGYRYIGYNMRKPPFNDRRVRWAFAHLCDLEKIKTTILANLVERTTGPFLPQSKQYNSNLQPIAYNPKKALALLNEAGYRDSDNDGWIDFNAKRLEVELLIPAGTQFYDQFASILKEDTDKMGLTLNIRKLEFQTLVKKVNERDFQAVMLGWSSGIESDPYQLWHTSQVKEGHNFTGFGNATSDGLIAAARLEFDSTRRNRLYHEFHRLVYDEQP